MVCSETRTAATLLHARPQPVRRADQGGGVKAGQHLTPGGAGGVEVAVGQPTDEPAIGRSRRQPLPVVAGEHLPQQDRQRPAVEHDVVIGQHKPVLIGCGADQCRPERRLVGQVADRGALSRAQRLDLLVEVAPGAGPGRPGHVGIGRDDLDRLVELVGESGRQVGMAGEHRLHGIAQPMPIEPTAQRDIELHRVHIVAGAVRDVGVEQQSLLQRGQRQDVGDLVVGA